MRAIFASFLLRIACCSSSEVVASGRKNKNGVQRRITMKRNETRADAWRMHLEQETSASASTTLEKKWKYDEVYPTVQQQLSKLIQSLPTYSYRGRNYRKLLVGCTNPIWRQTDFV